MGWVNGYLRGGRWVRSHFRGNPFRWSGSGGSGGDPTATGCVLIAGLAFFLLIILVGVLTSNNRPASQPAPEPQPVAQQSEPRRPTTRPGPARNVQIDPVPKFPVEPTPEPKPAEPIAEPPAVPLEPRAVRAEDDLSGELRRRQEALRESQRNAERLKNEEKASANLRYANKLASDPSTRAAGVQRLREVVSAYPETPAAAEAKRVLDKMGERAAATQDELDEDAASKLLRKAKLTQEAIALADARIRAGATDAFASLDRLRKQLKEELLEVAGRYPKMPSGMEAQRLLRQIDR